MNAELEAVALSCLRGAHDGSLSFPQIVARLAGAGFESYHVDFRARAQTYHLQGGDTVTFAMHASAGTVAEEFDADGVATAVRVAQANDADYTYNGFCERIRAAGCSGYLASIVGRRVLYYGRTAETHVEHFPK